MSRIKTTPGEVLRAKNPRVVTVETALRLSRYFGTTPQLWLNLQQAYDLSVQESSLRPRIEREVSPRAA